MIRRDDATCRRKGLDSVGMNICRAPGRSRAKFCDECGTSLIHTPRELTIQGFRRSSDNALKCCEEEWDELRAEITLTLAGGTEVKNKNTHRVQSAFVHGIWLGGQAKNVKQGPQLKEGRPAQVRWGDKGGDCIMKIPCLGLQSVFISSGRYVGAV